MKKRILILEGICGAGKSTLLTRLSQTPQVAAVWSQKTTYGPLVSNEDAGTLNDRLIFEILQRLSRRLEIEIQRLKGALVLDTLHLTQYVRPGVLTKESFVAIDQKLDSLGPQIVFLKMSAEEILQRTIRARKHTDFFDYIQKFGSTEDQLVEYFRREQERMEDILRDVSCLPITSVEEGTVLERCCEISLELLSSV